EPPSKTRDSRAAGRRRRRLPLSRAGRPSKARGSGGRAAGGLRGWRLRVHGDAHARLAVALERDDAVDLREQRPVAADADVLAGVELGADLANQDAAGRDLLAGEPLHAAHLRQRVAAVARRALSFLVSHGACPILV